jgi:CyaY protein
VDAAAEAAGAALAGFAFGSTSGPRWPQPTSRPADAARAAEPSNAPKTLAERRRSGATTLDAARYGMPRSVPMTTMSASPFSDAEYHQRASAALAAVETQVDRWLDEDVIDIDSHRTGGLLELALPNGSKLIINTQPPLHELWLAAKAGGYHFRLDASGRWLDTKDGAEFFQRLSEQASAQTGKPLTFAPPA